MSRDNRLRPLAFWGLAFVGLCLRIGLAFEHASSPPVFPDETAYRQLANSMVERGGFFVNYIGTPEIVRGPSYGLFLSAFRYILGDALIYPLIAQAILGILTALFLASLVGRLLAPTFADTRFSASVALALIILAPTSLLYDRLLLSECWASFLVAFHLWLSVRFRESSTGLVAAGGVLGLLVLTKPAFILYPPFAFLFGALIAGNLYPLKPPQLRASLRASAIAWFSCAAIVLPWTVRNYVVSGKLIPVGIGGGVFLYVGSVDSLTSEEALAFDSYLAPMTPVSERIEIDREFGRRAWVELRARPLRNVVAGAKRGLHLWVSSHAATLGGGMNVLLRGAVTLHSVIMIGLAILAFLLSPRGLRLELAPLVCIPVYTTLIHLPINSGARYAVPAWPSVLALAAIGVVLVWRRVSPTKGHLREPVIRADQRPDSAVGARPPGLESKAPD